MVQTVHWTEVDDDLGLPASKATVFDVGAHFAADDFDRPVVEHARLVHMYDKHKGEWTVHFHTLVRKLGKHAPASARRGSIRTPAPIATLDAAGSHGCSAVSAL